MPFGFSLTWLHYVKAAPNIANPFSIVRVEEPGVLDPGAVPGRLARRLIGDWHLGLLDDNPHDSPQEANPSEWACPRLRAFYRRKTNASVEHDLIVIPTQSYDETNVPGGEAVLSCLCRSCRYHFVFKISAGSCGSLRDNPQHHFLLNGIEEFSPANVENDPAVKLYPLRCHALYTCSACTQTIEVEVTAPRLVPEWIHLISDEQRITQALNVAREEDPDRYANIGPEAVHRYVTTSLQTLNAYLKDVVESAPEEKRKRISSRNKTFMVQFGTSCDHIFHYLGFEFEPVEEAEEGRVEGFWLPPKLDAQEGKTPLKSDRAFIEDVRGEVQALLEESSPDSGDTVVRLISPIARASLEKALKATLGPGQGGKTAIKEEAADFRLLGAATDADDETLKWAFHRQVHTDPGHKEAYLSALNNLGLRRDVDFQVFCFAQQDQQVQTTNATSDDPVDKAYAHFNLDRTRSEPASFFINVYKNFREQSPAQKSAHRAALLQIGKDRNDNEILSEVYMTQMEHSEACTYLSVDPTWPLESIAVSAQSTIQVNGIRFHDS